MKRLIALALLCLCALPCIACPVLDGDDPDQDLKAALDYYPTQIAPSRSIAGADCAKDHFDVTLRRELDFRAARKSRNYSYGRFLDEVADLQAAAARRVRSTGGGDGVGYYRQEVEVRVALLAWCLQDNNACQLYKQLGALANAYQAAGQAPDLHNWMVNNSPESMAASATVKIWLEGIYSCPDWNFSPPMNGSLYVWKENCSESCIAVARDASQLLKEHGVRIPSLKDQISALVRSVDQCER